MYATIIISSRQRGIGDGLTYGFGFGLGLGPGSLVKVPLRKRLVEGIVIDIQKEKPEGDFDVKEIAEVLSDQPLLSAEQIAVAKWMAEYYVCTVRQALSVFLPGMPWSRLVSGAPKGRQKEARNGIPIYHSADGTDQSIVVGSVRLTPRQAAAYRAIRADRRPTLLFGVTGSGKTEIYAAMIRDAIREGKSAILLLPEILLTENFVGRFRQLIDRDAIAVVHSRLTPAKRREAWRQCRSGEARLIIGSRSALFSPVQNLGLVIIDEEHEWTYKNEKAPRYHARSVAEIMCSEGTFNQRSHATVQRPKLVLGSATPSVDAWYRAKTGDYQLVELPERYGGAALPSVQIVDLAQVAFGRCYPLSPTLINAIRTRLQRREQIVLFLNRRGFATSLMCLDCRYRFEDQETGLPYTVHYGRGAECGVRGAGWKPYLLSHHTGEKLSIPEKCPKCGGTKLREVGAGTQRIESLLGELFPHARLLRADSDTLRSPEQMRMLLAAMQEGRADILLGTQSVVKGLDLPNVTLAAVLLADIGLSLPHFRAGERVFQLLTQLTGRSGRKQPGEVIIQTFRPEAMEIALSAAHDVRTYLERELAGRRKAHYPPDTGLVRFVFSGSDAKEASRRFSEILQGKKATAGPGFQGIDMVKTGGGLMVSRSPSLFSGSRVWQVLVRGGKANLARVVRDIVKKLPEFDGAVDVDPAECL